MRYPLRLNGYPQSTNMISLGRRWDGVERDCERRDGCRVRWANGLGMDQGLLAACPPVSSRKTAFPDASIRSDHARRVRSGSEFELGLGGGSCRCDRWRPRRQTDMAPAQRGHREDRCSRPTSMAQGVGCPNPPRASHATTPHRTAINAQARPLNAREKP